MSPKMKMKMGRSTARKPAQPFLHHLRGRFFRHNVPGGAIPAAPAEPAVRKSQATLTANEQARFLAAINTFNGNGFYGAFVAIHADMRHRMHSMDGPIGTQRFLPWHRAYLVELERELRTLDPALFIPYWDWTVARDVPAWLASFTPTVIADGRRIVVTRTPGQSGALPTQNGVNNALANATYTPFTSALEQVHNTVHVWVGGTMSSIPTAPADPLFWMHHTNIDRLWNVWQQTHANQNPQLTGQNAVLDPWTLREPDTRRIADLGYSYAAAQRAAGHR